MIIESRRSLAIPIHALLEAGLDAVPRSAWHNNPGPDGIWRWHASSLFRCPRELILQRAGFATDGTPLTGRLVMHMGSAYHALMEAGAGALEQHGFRVVATEQGYVSTQRLLVGKPDVVCEAKDDGSLWIVELKGESTHAVKRRREDGQGTGTNARLDHRRQVAAQMLCMAEDATEPLRDRDGGISGIVVYIDRNDATVEVCPALVSAQMVEDVKHRVDELEQAWAAYERDGTLPPRLPDDDWACRPRARNDARGRYCQARFRCRGCGGDA